MKDRANDGQLSSLGILAVVVLYKTHPSESEACRSLLAAIDQMADSSCSVRVIIFDNTPGGQDPGRVPENVQYIAAQQNLGLAIAYNRALVEASEEGVPWLLTLDADTKLPPDFLAKMSEYAASYSAEPTIAAIVPQLRGGSSLISPLYIGRLRNSAVPAGYVGWNEREMYALNSAALLRVSAIEKVGGFCEDFWLDQLDLVLHRMLHQAGLRVFIAGDIQVVHKLSLQDPESLLPDRIQNFLQAESAYFDLYRRPLDNRILTLVLLFRYIQYRVRGTNPHLAKATLTAFKNRLLRSRSARIAEWRRSSGPTGTESIHAGAGMQPPTGRPRISVCMATYNGQQFVAEQLQTILDQLASDDEIIVVDDASTDSTCQIIRALKDSRVTLIARQSNQGILRTFEEAILRAQGEVLFLADQDDLWTPDKVSAIMEAFRSDPRADLVVSDATLIGHDGAPISPSYYAGGPKFRPGVFANIIQCRFLGCTMAFRSRIRARIIPFPRKAEVLHDIWIGTVNSIAGGKSLFIDRPLVLYRRHEANVTGNRRLSFRRRVRIRWDLCRSLARVWLSWRFGTERPRNAYL